LFLIFFRRKYFNEKIKTKTLVPGLGRGDGRGVDVSPEDIACKGRKRKSGFCAFCAKNQVFALFVQKIRFLHFLVRRRIGSQPYLLFVVSSTPA
jgi:hypothetical protein